MKEPSREISDLCTSWWEALADVTKADQHHVAEQFMRLLGWSDWTPVEGTGISPQIGPATFIVRGNAQVSIVMCFVLPGCLESGSSLVERGLDFCETTRILTRAAGSLDVGYVFITDLYRSYLYDVRTDELLLYADDPKTLRSDLAPVLTRANVERGSLDEIRRNPRSVVARQLREWMSRWTETLAVEARESEANAQTAMDRFIVLRYLFDHDVLKHASWRLQKRFRDIISLAISSNPRGCGRQIVSLFHDAWFDCNVGLFEALPRLDEALENDRIAIPLLSELALLSRGKFSIATILESFNFGDPQEKARVRMMPDPENKREDYLARQTLATVNEVRIDLDIAEEGYRAIFHWFDKLISLYDRLEREFDTAARSSQRSSDLDLLAWSELDSRRPAALVDKYAWAIERAMTLSCENHRQIRTARLMLYLHFINKHHQIHQRLTRFPKMEQAFRRRAAAQEVAAKAEAAGQPARRLVAQIEDGDF